MLRGTQSLVVSYLVYSLQSRDKITSPVGLLWVVRLVEAVDGGCETIREKTWCSKFKVQMGSCELCEISNQRLDYDQSYLTK